jgi:hypothetical protein
MSVMSVVCCQVEVSSRRVLPSAVCLSDHESLIMRRP